MVLLLVLCVSFFVLPVSALAQQLAFPTAEGFGRFSTGGRGGRAYNINSLSANAGTGGSCNAGGCSGGTITFRDCLLDRFGVGARTCIFRTGGTIDWSCNACYSAIPPLLTIAGQTAPGGGIMIKRMQLELRNTHNVILRHLRVRPGASAPDPDVSGAIEVFGPTTPVHDVIIDHYSMGWTADDSMSGVFAYNVTYQWGLVSEGVGNLPTGPSKVGLWTSDTNGGQVSLLHNFWMNHNYRAPLIGAGIAQLVNNVVYNINDRGTYLYPHANYGNNDRKLSVVNSYYRPGPNSAANYPRIQTLGGGVDEVTSANALRSSLYMSGNVHTVLRPDAGSGSDMSILQQVGSPLIPVVGSNFGEMPTIPSQTSAAQAVTDVLAKAGAYAVAGGSATVRRDSIDQRAITDFTNGTGRIDIGNESTVGGYPTYSAGTPYTDTDGDGISDSWETAHGLHPDNAADGPAIHANGYSNLENFINELAGDTIPDLDPMDPDIVSNLVGYWKFNDDAGTATDSSGNGHTGTFVNGATYGTGPPDLGDALSVNGTNQSVSVAHTAALNLTGQYTLALWAFPTSSLTTPIGAVMKDFGYWLYASSVGVCGTGGVFAGHGVNVCHATALTANTWAHLAVTYDGMTIRLYKNGTEVATQATGTSPSASTGLLTIGKSAFSEFFPGRLDEVRIYSRALTAEEVGLVQAVTDPPPPSTAAAPVLRLVR